MCLICMSCVVNFVQHFFCFFKRQTFVRSQATSFSSFRFFGVLHSGEGPANGVIQECVVPFAVSLMVFWEVGLAQTQI